MTVHDRTPRTDRTAAQTGAAGAASPQPRGWRQRRRERRQKPKLRRLRVIVVLTGVVTIAAIAFLFGVLTSVASDLHGLSNQVQFNNNVDSVLYDDTGTPIGVLAPPNKPVMDKFAQISPNMIHAIVSVEDKNFWTDPGIDLRSLARALVDDVTGGPTEGASTIAEEFVKNVEQEEDHRTVLEKLREAGLAFQLVHQWKRAKILTQYLNIIYFGNGAYGIEAAARYYFGKQLGYDPNNPSGGTCGTATVTRPHLPSCASRLKPYQAAMLAAMVANPSAFNPLAFPRNAEGRRNTVVLKDMYAQGYISRAQYEHALIQPVPQAQDVEQATEPAAAPYFTSWVRPQIVRALEKEGVAPERAQYEAYYGGLKIKLSINLKLQTAAQNAVDAQFPKGSDGPTATLVSIDNHTGQVLAMVSGNQDYSSDPFNLATLGYRQPGSAFKVFTLAVALKSGRYGPGSVIDSKPLDIPFTEDGVPDHFVVRNFGNTYSGPETLSEATAISDNTVFAQVGLSLGTTHIASMAKAMGIRSPISTNPAMIIGGLSTGVSALDMAHAYETLATGGLKVYNPILGDVDHGPIGIDSIANCHECNQADITNHPSYERILPEGVASTIHTMLEGVVSSGGTAPMAAIPGVDVVGKTGTTSNYVDAWFCGWTPTITTCVWVGYANHAKAMLTNYNGQPVEGGTFPALIWRDYVESALPIIASEQSGSGTSSGTVTTSEPDLGTGTEGGGSTLDTGTTQDTTPAPADTGAATTPARATATPTPTTPDATPAPVQTVPATPAPAQTVPATPATPAGGGTAPSGGATGSGSSSGTGGAGLGGG